MIYLITQILLCLLVAFLLGLLVGYLLCKLFCGSKKNNHSVDTDDNLAAAGFVSPYVDDEDDTAMISLDTDINLDEEIYDIETLEGIGPQTGDLFRGYGISSVGDFLRKLHSPSSRKQAAKDLNILEKPLHDWASMSDLLRVVGIDHQYAELAHAAGIKTVGELGRSDAEYLTAEMVRVNSAGKQLIAPTAPSSDVVSDWINTAKDMSPVVSV